MMPILHSELAKRARAALTTDPRTKDATIKVLDQNGVLTLEGTVPSEAACQASEEIVREQQGVIKVINQLQVSPVDDPLAPSPPIPPEEHPYIDA
jgi:osmotically-inducible protein OsmY